jgi:cell division protein ZapA (FtsZ GTPase activity inhibitor)
VSMDQKSVVSVVIAGEEYSLRADAAPDYTRECAAYLDRTVSEILRKATLIEPQKGFLLAALSLTDQLFQARAELEAVRREMARVAGEIEARLTHSDLASLP